MVVNIELAVLAAVFGLSQSGLSANCARQPGYKKAGKESLPAFRPVMRYGFPLGTAMALPVADVGRRDPERPWCSGTSPCAFQAWSTQTGRVRVQARDHVTFFLIATYLFGRNVSQPVRSTSRPIAIAVLTGL
ncbi:hypothetical protein [Paraburkholderia strydomiana]|uniref:hypothetical protein n=1 Tax=Paraburkholderia strydomiana TaxID=1245417 RepID=UPI001BEA777D|nr:hypothetical protein [Paraburkholderia strydomiana]MBT2793504.1 hypothetical protein [Paraburkholderia strydomiana]